MATTWPVILRPQQVDCFLAPMVAFGPRATSGRRQAIGTDAGCWQLTLSGVPIRTADQVREWRRLVTALQGGLVDLLVGPFDCRQAPRLPGQPIVQGGIPHSDGSPFSDGGGYSQSTINVVLDGDHDLRATHLSCTIIAAGPLRGGMYFSIADRLYQITSQPDVSGDVAEFDFLPQLRADALDGGTVEFGRPRGTFRLASPDAGRLALRTGRFAEPSVDLVESFEGL